MKGMITRFFLFSSRRGRPCKYLFAATFFYLSERRITEQAASPLLARDVVRDPLLFACLTNPRHPQYSQLKAACGAKSAR